MKLPRFDGRNTAFLLPGCVLGLLTIFITGFCICTGSRTGALFGLINVAIGFLCFYHAGGACALRDLNSDIRKKIVEAELARAHQKKT
jgi:hypothetical protein